MKKLSLVALGLVAFVTGKSQFSDDFESYNVGDYVGEESPVWRVWSNTGEGTAEDVMVTDEEAASGSNSIHFSSVAANGGPQDVVLPFGAAFSSGVFDFSFNIKVAPGSGAYFNFQATETIGETWAMDCYFNADQTIALSNSGTTYLESNFKAGVWTNVSFSINLSTNTWTLSVDGEAVGSFFNPVNSVALLDIYPLNGDDFYMDDVAFDHTPLEVTGLNGAVTNVLGIQNLLAGATMAPTIQVRNLGADAITSFDVTMTYNGDSQTETFSGLNLASLDYTTVAFEGDITVAGGVEDMTVCISNVNGAGDDSNADDDCKVITVNPALPAVGKMVIGEEGTGTWCGWCPRGTVAMEHMAEAFPETFQGIAVHNGDPMTNDTYDAWMGSKISGYPSALVDRGAVIDPGNMEAGFFERIIVEPNSHVTVLSAAYNGDTKKIDVEVEVEFVNSTSGASRVFCALVEDSVTGTGSGYNQSNYYAGGGNGVMGGYESLPSSVPAAQMVYNDVARGLAPNAGGTVIGVNMQAGETETFSFSFDVDDTWDPNNMVVVPFVTLQSGEVDNANNAPIDMTNAILEASNDFGMGIYPNPANEVANIKLQLKKADKLVVSIVNLAGQVVSTQDYGVQFGSVVLPVNTTVLAEGLYVIKVQVGETEKSERLSVEK